MRAEHYPVKMPAITIKKPSLDQNSSDQSGKSSNEDGNSSLKSTSEPEPSALDHFSELETVNEYSQDFITNIGLSCPILSLELPILTLGPSHFLGLALEDTLGIFSNKTKQNLGTFNINIIDEGDSVIVEGKCEGLVESVTCGTHLKATIEKIGLQTLEQTHYEYTKVVSLGICL